MTSRIAMPGIETFLARHASHNRRLAAAALSRTAHGASAMPRVGSEGGRPRRKATGKVGLAALGEGLPGGNPCRDDVKAAGQGRRVGGPAAPLSRASQKPTAGGAAPLPARSEVHAMRGHRKDQRSGRATTCDGGPTSRAGSANLSRLPKPCVLHDCWRSAP